MTSNVIATLIALSTSFSGFVSAEPSDLAGVTRIIVADSSEAVHYKDGDAFKVLRGLLGATLATAPASQAEPESFPYKIVLHSAKGEQQMFLAGNLLKNNKALHQVSEQNLKKLMHIIESRAGQGVPK